MRSFLAWIRSWGNPAEEPEYMAVRRLAAKLWMEDRRVGCNRGLHGFMVCYPPTRKEYEARAKLILGVP